MPRQAPGFRVGIECGAGAEQIVPSRTMLSPSSGRGLPENRQGDLLDLVCFCRMRLRGIWGVCGSVFGAAFWYIPRDINSVLLFAREVKKSEAKPGHR